MDFIKTKAQFGSWAEYFKPFIESKQFDKIFRELKARHAAGAKICPENINVFRCFRETDFNSLQVVLLAQDPYHRVISGNYAADGLAFSASIISELPAPLQTLYDGMEADLANGFDLHQYTNPDMTYLTRQGVLLLNTSLTAEEGSPGAHRALWRPFIEFFLEGILNRHKQDIVCLLVGSNAKTFEKLINEDRHSIFAAEHPAKANKENRPWRHGNIFSCTNDTLRRMRQKEIVWYEKLPF